MNSAATYLPRLLISLLVKPLFWFSIVTNFLMLAPAIHMMQVYDRVLSSGSQPTLLYISMIAIGALVLFGVAESIREKIAQRMASQYVIDQSDPLFARLTSGNIPVDKSNEIMRNFNTVRSFIASRAMIGLFDLPFSPFFLLLLYLLHFQLGLLTTIGMAILIAVAWINKSSTAEDRETASQANNEALGFAGAVASRSEDIRAMGLLPALVERWGGMMGKSLNANDDSSNKSAFFFGLSKTVRLSLQIMIMAWGAWLVLQGEMSGGLIFAASMISGRALQPIDQVIGGWDSINRARKAHESIEEVLNKVEPPADKVFQPEPRGRLDISGLSHSIQTGMQNFDILTDFNFTVMPGQVVAVVGPSGGGKSTLARLIAGAGTPTTGEILLDGCQQKNWPPEQWGQYVGYVGQEILLFPGTIAENIARMATKPDDRAVIAAASLTGAHDMINSFPNGYMTPLGNGGIRLSGGQKQRIALARALYTRPKLLVLDEPNAHLDQHGDAVLMQTLSKLKESGVAILIVTQRRQILQIADKILLVKDGRQAEFVDAKSVQQRQQEAPPAEGRPVAPQIQSQGQLQGQPQGQPMVRQSPAPNATYNLGTAQSRPRQAPRQRPQKVATQS